MNYGDNVDEEIYTNPPIPYVEFKTRDIREIVDELKNALKKYANSIEIANASGYLDANGNIVGNNKDKEEVQNVISSRGQIQNIIESFQPNNEQSGIFEDIIALLPETQMEQFEQSQMNILSDSHKYLPIDRSDDSFIDALAKNIVLGKAGVSFAYKNRVEKLSEAVSTYIPKIVEKLSSIPALEFTNIDFESLNNFLKNAKTEVSEKSNKAKFCSQNVFDDLQNSVSVFFGLIKNTADQLWNLTPTEYQYEIWGDRSQYVKKDGTLVDPVEQVHLNLIVDMLKQKYCGNSETFRRSSSVAVSNPYVRGSKVLSSYYTKKMEGRNRRKESPYGGKSRKSRKRVKNTHKNRKNRQRKNKTRRRKNKTKSKK
jgi:hypothetical protein